MRQMKLLVISLLLGMMLLVGMGQAMAVGNLLVNPTFEGVLTKVPPTGWSNYGRKEGGNAITGAKIDDSGQIALHVIDASTEYQIGLYQAVPAKAGEIYTLSAIVKAVTGASTEGSNIQMRFMPAGERINVSLSNLLTDEFQEVSVSAMAPDGTTSINVYVWTGVGSVTEFLVREISLVQFEL
jgi:hypothetical protein